MAWLRPKILISSFRAQQFVEVGYSRKTARGASSPAKPALHIPELVIESADLNYFTVVCAKSRAPQHPKPSASLSKPLSDMVRCGGTLGPRDDDRRGARQEVGETAGEAGELTHCR